MCVCPCWNCSKNFFKLVGALFAPPPLAILRDFTTLSFFWHYCEGNLSLMRGAEMVDDDAKVGGDVEVAECGGS